MEHPTTASDTDTIYTRNEQVSCQGNGPATGHPLIYLNFGDKSDIVCPYCSRHFAHKE